MPTSNLKKIVSFIAILVIGLGFLATLLAVRTNLDNRQRAATSSGTATIDVSNSVSTTVIAPGSKASLDVIAKNVGSSSIIGIQAFIAISGNVPADITFAEAPITGLTPAGISMQPDGQGKILTIGFLAPPSQPTSLSGGNAKLGTITFTAPSSGSITFTVDNSNSAILQANTSNDLLGLSPSKNFTFGVAQTSPTPTSSSGMSCTNYVEGFDGSSLNTSFWMTPTQETIAVSSVQSGKLIVSMPGGASRKAWQKPIKPVGGDFTISLDMEELSYSPSTSAYAQEWLGITSADSSSSKYIYIGRSNGPNGYQVATATNIDGQDTNSKTLIVSNPGGKVKMEIQKTGTSIKAYFTIDSGTRTLLSTYTVSDASTFFTPLIYTTTLADFPAVHAQYDNFSITCSQPAPTISPKTCWNRVVNTSSVYYWPDGCKGTMPAPGTACTTAMVQLTSAELTAYLQWVSQGKPAISGCSSSTPFPTVQPTVVPTTGVTVINDPTCARVMCQNTNGCSCPSYCNYEKTKYNWTCGGLRTGATPVPTATAAPKACNETCSTNADCPTGLSCVLTSACPPGTQCIREGVYLCRNVACTGSSTCSCASPTIAPTNSPTATPISSAPKILVSFAGVSSDRGTIRARVKAVSATSTIFDLTLPFVFDGNGKYRADFSNVTLPAATSLSTYQGTNLSISMKGEKHVQRIVRNILATSTGLIDLSAKPLEVGDLPTQDGIVNAADIDKVLSRMSASTTSTSDLNIADVNYDGTINAVDMGLILSTLSTKTDETL